MTQTKSPPSPHPTPKNVCIRTSFLEQAIPGTWSKPLAKEIAPNSPLCNRVANEYDTDHVQKQVNVIQDRSFCNQPAVCNSHYGTVLVFLLIWEFSFKFGQRRSIQALECGRIVRVHSSALLHSIYHLDHGDTFLSYDHHLWTSKNSWYSLVVGWLFLQDSSWNKGRTTRQLVGLC